MFGGEAMGAGLGRVQRAILRLIKANPHRAFSMSMICAEVYGGVVDRKQRSAVLRALGATRLPGCWVAERLFRECVLWDPSDDESALEHECLRWHGSLNYRPYLKQKDIDDVLTEADRVRRWRDGGRRQHTWKREQASPR